MLSSINADDAATSPLPLEMGKTKEAASSTSPLDFLSTFAFPGAVLSAICGDDKAEDGPNDVPRHPDAGNAKAKSKAKARAKKKPRTEEGLSESSLKRRSPDGNLGETDAQDAEAVPDTPAKQRDPLPISSFAFPGAVLPADLDDDKAGDKSSDVPQHPDAGIAKAKAKSKAKAKAKKKPRTEEAESESSMKRQSLDDDVEETDAQDDEAGLDTPAKKKQRKLRQAQEVELDDGRVQVEVLCPKCKQQPNGGGRQSSIMGFFKAPSVTAAADSGPTGTTAPAGTSPAGILNSAGIGPAVFSHGAAKPGEVKEGTLFCSRCLAPMSDNRFASDAEGFKVKSTCPLGDRLKRYKDTAKKLEAPWLLTDSQALAMMRAPCTLCGEEADLMMSRCNGITRLRENGGERSMGPFSPENTATACSNCNMIKGIHRLEEIRNICRHIATNQGFGDYGRFYDAFRNNTSKPSRSRYLADHKTYALTNEQFNAIVEKPCFYCGKETTKGTHHNGLDRLENQVRVYTENTCVSCCGTCNMAKGRLSVELFFRKCREIAAKATSAAT